MSPQNTLNQPASEDVSQRTLGIPSPWIGQAKKNPHVSAKNHHPIQWKDWFTRSQTNINPWNIGRLTVSWSADYCILILPAGWHISCKILFVCLAGGWTNPFEKYAHQIWSFPQLEVNIKKYLKPPPRRVFFLFYSCLEPVNLHLRSPTTNRTLWWSSMNGLPTLPLLVVIVDLGVDFAKGFGEVWGFWMWWWRMCFCHVHKIIAMIYIYILVRTLLVGLVRKALINGFDIAWISMPSQQKKVVEEIECFHQ